MVDQSQGARPKQTNQRVVFSDSTWEVQRNKVQIQKKLGEGAFGEVWRAVGHDIGNRNGPTVVAVKFLRGQ